ncbi:HECT-like ubiquitin-conjugating enzyme-binding-domain-containing protein [Multifurca ochricompacta]|uniref:HECT-like ubiquitin-conjugating enzyme-binding-domain-containing protein n=1 Tax=Multifurca ochricompacta TaxID=376703 RepID=A0AAD4M4H6_9AGAM|nr:HECT-like ubiquitin-conjugating enzyme-binding-domain-containing protein [Multifurca ochricompacta]
MHPYFAYKLQIYNQDVIPSITRVQVSVLTTLNDLLFPFSPYIQTQRHSSSSSSPTTSFTPSSSNTSLRTLVANLRNSRFNTEMIQVSPTDDEATLLHELSGHVDALSPSLQTQDARLSHALVSLLTDLNRLSVLSLSSPSSSTPAPAWAGDASVPSVGNLDALARQLSEFQSQHHDQSDSERPLPPVVAVEKALLWLRLEENLETVLSLCNQREEERPRLSPSDPPQYRLLSHDNELPPGYDPDQESLMFDDTKTLASFSGHSRISIDEKMRLDLDAVTMAIDRLYRVAPQLHNQRVELNSSKLQRLESARTMPAAPASTGKQKERELERIVDMIGRASERKLVNQTVVLGDMDARVERARQRDVLKRQEFVDKLAEHSGARRIHAQDAAFSTLRVKDPDALLTLPEFIRESVPPAHQPPPDPSALLSLDEAAREYRPSPSTPGPSPLLRSKSLKGLRTRSMSAPALNWLLPTSSKLANAENATRSVRGTLSLSRRSSSAGKGSSFTSSDLQVSYVAEYHENLRHVLAFLSVSGLTPGVNLEASVVANSHNVAEGLGSALVLRSGSIESPALALPACTKLGTQEVRVQGLHYEVKVAALDNPSLKTEPLPLLDAEQLRARSPTSFICASCSLPLIHGARITRYDDLPSEHWAELVDAWMCHTDQGLSAQVARHAKGFWPHSGQALVGGSYILFDKSAAVSANLRPVEKLKQGEEWRSVRCMCGTLSGRCQDHVTEFGETATVYRLVKYAIRPVSPSAEPCRIPLSAFIVEDMAELARAHAIYRFIILDEEEERPRILLWLFKPSMRLSYKASRSYLLPERGTIQAAKVLFKILGPSMSHTDLGYLLDRYPGFPQAEQLMYPRDTCTQIAVLLRESNRCYPEGMRSMTGLDVGWLLRA